MEKVLGGSSALARVRKAMVARSGVVGAPSFVGVVRELRAWAKKLR